MFEIEKVDMEHIDRIRPLWEKLIQANAANSPYFADYYGTFEFEIRKGFLQEKLDNGAAMYTAVLVDREKKQDAGFVTVTYNRDTSFGEIEMLYLLEEYRGQGIGTELLRAMMDALEREGVRQVSLSVQKGNPAVRLYRRVGFRIVRETEEEYIMVDRLGRASSGKEHAHAGQAGGRGGPIQPDRGQAGRAGDL